MDELERRLTDLERQFELQAQRDRASQPHLERLVRDQSYRDYRHDRSAKRWRVWAVRLAVATGIITVTGSVARTVWQVVHVVFHLQ